MLACRQIGVFFQMLRAKRLGNRMLLAEPLAQINQPATPGAKWPVTPGEPIALLFARWTLDLRGCTHRKALTGIRRSFGRRLPHLSPDGFKVVGDGNCLVPFCAADLENSHHVGNDRVELR